MSQEFDLTDFHLQLETLGYIETSWTPDGRRCTWLKDPKLLNWAIAVLEKTGWTAEQIMERLNRYPSDRHWWAIRQMVPTEAFESLSKKLSN